MPNKRTTWIFSALNCVIAQSNLAIVSSFKNRIGMAHLLCLSGDGIPIFSRCYGKAMQKLPFPIVGSLSAADTFAGISNAFLSSASSDTNPQLSITWKKYCDGNLQLILVKTKDYLSINQSVIFDSYRNTINTNKTHTISTNSKTCYRNHKTSYEHLLLDYVFYSLILFSGSDSLFKVTKNVDKFKSVVKLSLPLIDILFSFLNNNADFPSLSEKHFDKTEQERKCVYDSSKDPHHFSQVSASVNPVAESAVDFVGHLTGCAESLPVVHSDHLIGALVGYAKDCGTVFAALFIDQKLCACSPKWESLRGIETVLIQNLLSTLNYCAATTADVPVYLPLSSASVPHRLVTIQLHLNVQLVCLCGPTPPVSFIRDSFVKKHFQHLMHGSLLPLLRYSKNKLPECCELDEGILGLLLVNRERNRLVVNTELKHSKRACHSRKKRVNELLQLFCAVCPPLYTSLTQEILCSTGSSSKPNIAHELRNDWGLNVCGFGPDEQKENHFATKVYMFNGQRHLFAVRKEGYELYLSMDGEIPKCAVEGIATDTLNILRLAWDC